MRVTEGKPMKRIRCVRCGKKAEWICGDVTLCWDCYDQFKQDTLGGLRSAKRFCSKLDFCPKVQMVLDKAYDVQELYAIKINEVCERCSENCAATRLTSV